MAPTKAGKRLRRVAEKKGRAQDQYDLANLLYHGWEGLKQDRVAAAAWFRKAAAQEHAGAQGDLGACYVHGEGVEQNLELAVTWLGKAAEQGEVQAMHNLGFL